MAFGLGKLGRGVGPGPALTLLLFGLAGAPPVLAGTGGSITFGPGGPISVPTLGMAMALLLALFLGFMAMVALKRRAGVVPAVAAFFATGALLSVLGGSLVERAVSAGTGFSITESGGQTLSVTPGDLSIYSNNAGVPLEVLDVSLPGLCGPLSVATAGPTGCSLGYEVEAGSTCTIDCTVPPS